MCSIDEDDIPIEQKSRVEIAGDRKCMKCSESKAVVLVRLNDPLCKSCFLTYFTHKFRATIGKARVIRHDDKVLVAVSGGPNSLAMLKLVAHGYDESVLRKFRFIPSVVYIDEGAVLGLTKDDRQNTKKEIQQFVSTNGNFDFHEVALEDLFLDDDGSVESAIQKLKDCFSSVSTLTAKEDLLRSFRNQLLVKVASTTGIPKVMIGDSASRIAVRILSNISQGRGEALSYDTGFIDSRHGDIIILRPMREFVAKEVSLYNFFNEVEAVNIPTLATKSGCYASIDRLTEEFISGLQAQLPSTVSTVFRTGDKLSVNEAKDLSYHCSLCGVPVELLVQKTGNQNDVHLNQSANQEGDCESVDGMEKNSCCSQGECKSGAIQSKDLSKTLCYGCSLTMKDMKQGFDVLPLFAQESAKRQLNLSEIKEQINEFLLED